MLKPDPYYVCLTILTITGCLAGPQPWSRRSPSPQNQSGGGGDRSDVKVDHAGVVSHSSGEGLSLTDRGIYRLKARESRFRSVYKMSKEDPGGPRGEAGAEAEAESAWAEEVEAGLERGRGVDLREASQAELLAYMEEKNRFLRTALADALSQGSGPGESVLLPPLIII